MKCKHERHNFNVIDSRLDLKKIEDEGTRAEIRHALKGWADGKDEDRADVAFKGDAL